MDGGGRILRSLNAAVTDCAPSVTLPRLSTSAAPPVKVEQPEPLRPRARGLQRRSFVDRVTLFVEGRARILGYMFATGLFAAVGIFGVVQNGQFAAYLEKEGSLPDILARDLGFGIKTITISGINELPETELLAAGGITPKNSLAFLDAADVRRRLMAQPLIKEASVTKLYPNRLLIAITERVPYALWQKDGVVSIIGTDGLRLDDRRDNRHDHLPFVVGEKANEHIADYVEILARAGELRPKIRAGTLVAERRWDLTMNSGTVVRLPENDPAGALASLAALERSDRILDRDVVSLDLRTSGRIIARLTEEALAARSAALPRKSGKAKGSDKGSET